MATLTRPRLEESSVSSTLLDSQVPTPFPREQLVMERQEIQEEDEEHLITVEQHTEEGSSETVALVCE